MKKSLFLMIYVQCVLMSCGINDIDSHTETAPDLIGDWYFPLANLTYSYEYSFRTDTTTFDFETQKVETSIRNYGSDLFRYKYSNLKEGLILIHLETPAEKSGTYYAGYFNQDTLVQADSLVLFIPQFPQKGQKWNLWNGHQMEVLAADTVIKLNFSDDSSNRTLNDHKVAIYREAWSDWEIIHYYKQKVGLVAQQRNYKGHLISWGELTSWY